MIASLRVRQAQQSLEEARILVREGIGSKAVLAQLYHGMMNCLLALLGITDIGRLTHAEVIERFEREFGASAPDGESVVAALRRAYDLTHECDCSCMPVPTDREIDEISRAAAGLVAWTGNILAGEVKEHENSAV